MQLKYIKIRNMCGSNPPHFHLSQSSDPSVFLNAVASDKIVLVMRYEKALVMEKFNSKNYGKSNLIMGKF
jgi:hypothetical protein